MSVYLCDTYTRLHKYTDISLSYTLYCFAYCQISTNFV